MTTNTKDQMRTDFESLIATLGYTEAHRLQRYEDDGLPRVSDYIDRNVSDIASDPEGLLIVDDGEPLCQAIQECYGDCATGNQQRCPNPCKFEGRAEAA